MTELREEKISGSKAKAEYSAEDIQVLKGASAGAMYGSKASNGVIIIKTKRGGLSTRKDR